ncbi:MAG: histidine--tRNA ligase [Candidatus Hadarchaeales archaeon]
MQTPRGTRDLFGQDILAVRRTMEAMRTVFERYGYEEVETPVFEHVELFTKKSGSSIVKQLYTFVDKSGREMALRPELTAPVVRLYIQKLRSAPKPLKLFYFGSCFRYEEPQANRWRQFTQAGVEIIGSRRPEADAEVAALACEAIRSLGIKFKIALGNVKVLREVLEGAGITGDSQDPVLRAVDSGERERMISELRTRGIKKEHIDLILDISSVRGPPEVVDDARALVRDNRPALEALDDLVRIMDRLRDSGEDKFEVNLGIARGLEYYTGFVFEIHSGGVQLAGGGRYDDLIETLGGEPTPAVGVGFGVDRIARAYMEAEGSGLRQTPPVLVVPADGERLPLALRIASDLRRAGIKATPELMGRNLSKAMSYASSIGSKFVVIVGKREAEKGEVTLRDMETGKQRNISVEDLRKELARC